MGLYSAGILCCFGAVTQVSSKTLLFPSSDKGQLMLSYSHHPSSCTKCSHFCQPLFPCPGVLGDWHVASHKHEQDGASSKVRCIRESLWRGPLPSSSGKLWRINSSLFHEEQKALWRAGWRAGSHVRSGAGQI